MQLNITDSYVAYLFNNWRHLVISEALSNELLRPFVVDLHISIRLSLILEIMYNF